MVTPEPPTLHAVIHIRQFTRPARPFVHRKAVSTYTCRRLLQSRMLQSRTVRLCSMLRLCSMRLCGRACYKVAYDFVASSCGRGLTRAAFYQISTDSVLARSLSCSWTSCLASLRPFIEILLSLLLWRDALQAYSLLGVSSIFAKA